MREVSVSLEPGESKGKASFGILTCFWFEINRDFACASASLAIKRQVISQRTS